jgi:acyl carrier protein
MVFSVNLLPLDRALQAEPALLLTRVLRIAADVFAVPVDGLTPASSPDSIESWDSLNHLNMVLALEQELNIQFSPEEMEELLSIELIVGLLEEKLGANGSNPRGR